MPHTELRGTHPLKLLGGREVKLAPGSPEQQLAEAASIQHSRISHSQLVALGFTRHVIARRVRAATLHPIHRAVYGVGPRVEVELGAETAALLAVGDPVALSHESAAHLWGIWPVQPDCVHLIVPGQRAGSREGIVVHRSRRITAADVTIHRGLPVTTPARAFLDLADAHPPRPVERAFDEALALRIVSPTKVRDEERLLALFRHAQLPDRERNVQLGSFTVDFLWPDAHVAVEFDSFTWHTSPGAFRRDRAKDAYLKDAGIDLHRVTWTMLDDPIPLIARVVRALPSALS